MEILISVAAKIAEYTVVPIVAPIGRQMSYMFYYAHNFQMLADELEELEGEKGTIERRVNVERRNGKQIKDVVLKWLDQVDEITEKAKKLREDPYREKAECSKCSFPNLWKRRQLSRKAKKEANNVALVIGEGKKFERDEIGFLPPISGVGSTSAASRFVEFESRVPKMKDIMQALTDPKVSILGVYGLGGVGKSTLVDQLARKAKNDKLFDEVVKASVTRSPDHGRIQEEIADQLGLQFCEKSVLGRADRLRQRINMEKNILIILDDIWAAMKLEDIGIPYRGKIYTENREMESQGGHMGCKVLLISRNQDVLQQMETQTEFRLEALNEKETWRLFEDTTGSIAKDRTYEGIASEVAKKCAGLPVLIVTVARALKKKDKHVWKDALSQLARVDNKELQEITYSALELSYSQLESDEVKAFFLLCGVEGPRVLVQDLLKYAIGLGIFKHHIITVEDTRNRLYNIISALKASSLLHEDEIDVKSVKMHDIIHDVAISIATRDEYAFVGKPYSELTEWPTKDFLRSCSKIILKWCNIQKLPEKLDCPKLEFFHLSPTDYRSLQIPDSFFEGMRKVRMLDLTCMNMSSLPTSIRCLTELQTLCLNQCILGDIAIVGALKNLKILSLLHSSMAKLPSEIGQLTNLRMLDMSNSIIAAIPPNIISSLTSLEELYMGSASIEWEVGNSAKQSKNASLAELGQLPNLRALEVQIGEVWNLPRDLSFDKLERYNMVIGDMWKWTDNFGTSKKLKLKLPTSVHLEHGIKALTRGVESLWLDEINGISNVLFQLNGEGFPLLKHLNIQNNAQIQHIINSMEWNQTSDSFPSLETLELQNLSKLEKLSHGPLSVNSLSKLKVIKVKSCQQLKYLFSDSMVKRLSQLIDIEVSGCNSMQKIIFVENGSVGDNGIRDTTEFCLLRSLTLQKLPTLDGFSSDEFTKANDKRLATIYASDPFFNTKVAFPCLETLKLSSINLHTIWDDHQLSASCGLQNLTSLIVDDCGNLKHLFSFSMIRSLSKLNQPEISKCHMMEEIIDPEEGRNNVITSEEVRFPSLEKIIINDMKKLRRVWHCQFDGLKSMDINHCEKLVCIFPSCTPSKFCIPETLVVRNCGSVEEIFRLDANKTSCVEAMAELRELTLVGLPKLKQIWSMETEGIVSLHNLQAVRVESCDKLEYLFPFSVATRLQLLEVLKVQSCSAMKRIVAKKEEMEGTAIFMLHRLTSLDLICLHHLRGFYAGNYTLSCPSLKMLDVFRCENLMLFMTQSINYQEEHHDVKLGIPLQQPLFNVQEVIPNLERLTLNSKYIGMILQDESPAHLFNKLKILWVSEFEDECDNFPDWFLRNVPSLENLQVEHSSFKEIFPDKIYTVEEGRSQSSTRVKSLSLFHLPKLQHICKEGFQIDPVLEVLERLGVMSCSSLINLVPSSVTFTCLTILGVKQCNGLMKLITSGTARSLVKLRAMKIEECNLLEEIVTEKDGETKDDIAFRSLETLELISLPQLNKFCSSKCFIKFPLLQRVVVRRCPRMEIFSAGDTHTPNLRKVQVNDEEWFWEGSINETIQRIFTDMVAFHSFEHLNLCEFAELKYLWYGPWVHNMFKSLKYLVINKCDFLSHVLFTSNLLQVLQNLVDLEVKDCDSIETVFDVKGMDDKDVVVKQTTRLKNLTLSGLPRLKHIWNKDAQEVISFRNLRALEVVYCENLEYLFPLTLCQDLQLLEVLEVLYCGAMKTIVAKKEEMEGTAIFVLNQLTSLDLTCLYHLRGFYAGNYALSCPSLKKLDVFRCQNLMLFKIQSTNYQEGHHDAKLGIPLQQALFTVQEVIPNLEELTLNSKFARMIFQDEFPSLLFRKLKILWVCEFEDERDNFPDWFLRNVPSLEQLAVEHSSFKEIFPDKIYAGEDGRIQSSTRVKSLLLSNLPKVQHICKEGFQIDPVLEVLESLRVVSCSSLINLVPSSVTFTCLTFLEVKQCNGLMKLITSGTARSFVKLETMKIEECNLLEEIVTEKDGEAKDDIAFRSLETLELISLPRLNKFCSSKCSIKFPLLQRVVVRRCPRMEIFSAGDTCTPNLRKVQVNDEEWFWEGSINETIQRMFIDMDIPIIRLP